MFATDIFRDVWGALAKGKFDLSLLYRQPPGGGRVESASNRRPKLLSKGWFLGADEL